METITAFLLSLLLGVLPVEKGIQTHVFTRDEVPSVPGVGSIWESQMKETHIGNSGEINLVPRESERFVVESMRDGRPVFSGKTFGYSGKLIESSIGTLVYTDDCAEKVPEEYFAPPEVPNQCEWNVCVPPPIGATFVRRIHFFVSLHRCKPETASYSVSSISSGNAPSGERTIIANVKIEVNPFQGTSWTGHFSLDGRGQIYSESTNRVTEYSKIDVAIVPSIPQARTTVVQEIKIADSQKGEQQKSCDIVAFGDSLTEGLGATKDTSYPVYLEKFFEEAGKKVSVCNMGMSGNTSALASKRISQVISTKAKLAIVFFGANDAIQGVPEDITRKNLENIVHVLREANIYVVLVGLDVPGAKSMLHWKVAEELAVSFIPNALNGVYGQKGMVSSDGRHPNEAGYKKLAENIFTKVFSVLAR